MKNSSLIIMLLLTIYNGTGRVHLKENITFNTYKQPQKLVSITDDNFIINSVDNDFDINNIENKCQFFNKEYKLLKNKYSNQYDTITTYFKNIDTVVIFSNVENKFILSMNINSNSIGLMKNKIKTGQSKDYFIKKYPSLSNDYDTLKISNTEGFIYLQFSFNNNKLINILYRSTYID